MSQLPTTSHEWTLLDEKGQTALTFTSFIDIDYQNQGTALSYPIENGGLMAYNKVSKPLSITVTIGQQGTDLDFEHTLSKLKDYKINTTKLSIHTPSDQYNNMTLESFSYTRTSTSATGMGLLAVKAIFKEVRVVTASNTTIIFNKNTLASAQNATSASKTKTGQTQAPQTSGP